MQLQDLSPEALECRSMGHAWYHLTDQDHHYRAGRLTEFTRREACARCGAERDRTVSLTTMAVVRRRMRYPARYLMPGQPRVSRVEVLRAMYER